MPPRRRETARGKRDFSSLRVLSATRYDLVARNGSAERARVMLSEAGLLPAAASAGPGPWRAA